MSAMSVSSVTSLADSRAGEGLREVRQSCLLVCRYTFQIRVTAEHRAWARTAWAGWTLAERGAVAMRSGFGPIGTP